MILPETKEIIDNLNFAKKAFGKGSFRHFTNYINGLITCTKKTAKQIAKATKEKHHSNINRILTDAKIKQKQSEERYLKKIKYLFGKAKIFLLLDDTLVERNGKKIEATQTHFDHSENKYIKGRQFFTAILYTPFLQMPVFPELYSKDTDSKIEMANSLVAKLTKNKIKLDTILFDSWYSERELIQQSIDAKIRVVCAIKSNRNIMFEKSNRWKSLSFIVDRIKSQKLTKYKVGKMNYEVWEKRVRLTKLPMMNLIISVQKNEKKKTESKKTLISTNSDDKPDEIIRTYKFRWRIETFHRDIKQNLGFAKSFFRRREGVVRHAIFVSMAYAVLSLFLFQTGRKMTIGECCEFFKNEAGKRMLEEIVEIDGKRERREKLREVFIS